MKVLLVCSRRWYSPSTDYIAPFIYEQMKAIQEYGIGVSVLLVDKGAKGYWKAVSLIKKAIQEFSPDIVHAHYGLCGLISNLQRGVPVVTTFHGTDLHDKRIRLFSLIAACLSKRCIVVSNELKNKLFTSKKIRVLPCGVNTDLLVSMNKIEARHKLGWDIYRDYILFSKEFYNPVKNYPLAKASVDAYNSKFANGSNAELLEFIGYTRQQVLLLYNAVDCVLMTSDHEGSPQFIKEAMACNCPIVSVNVGDVKNVISGTEGCYLAKRDPNDIAQKLNLAIKHGKTNGRERVLKEFDSHVVAHKVIKVYEEVLRHE